MSMYTCTALLVAMIAGVRVRVGVVWGKGRFPPPCVMRSAAAGWLAGSCGAAAGDALSGDGWGG